MKKFEFDVNLNFEKKLMEKDAVICQLRGDLEALTHVVMQIGEVAMHREKVVAPPQPISTDSRMNIDLEPPRPSNFDPKPTGFVRSFHSGLPTPQIPIQNFGNPLPSSQFEGPSTNPIFQAGGNSSVTPPDWWLYIDIPIWDRSDTACW